MIVVIEKIACVPIRIFGMSSQKHFIKKDELSLVTSSPDNP
jgi:hypothetical protein